MAKYPDYLQSIPIDSNGFPIPWGSTTSAGQFQTHDDDSVKSPVSLTASVTTVNIPQQALRFHACVSSGKVRISETEDMSSYIVMGAGDMCSFDVAKMDKIYIRADAAAATMSFRLEII